MTAIVPDAVHRVSASGRHTSARADGVAVVAALRRARRARRRVSAARSRSVKDRRVRACRCVPARGGASSRRVLYGLSAAGRAAVARRAATDAHARGTVVAHAEHDLGFPSEHSVQTLILGHSTRRAGTPICTTRRCTSPMMFVFADLALRPTVAGSYRAVRQVFACTDWPALTVQFELLLARPDIAAHVPAIVDTVDRGLRPVHRSAVHAATACYPAGCTSRTCRPTSTASTGSSTFAVAAGQPRAGCYVEVAVASGRDCVSGCRYQPREPPLQIDRAQLVRTRRGGDRGGCDGRAPLRRLSSSISGDGRSTACAARRARASRGGAAAAGYIEAMSLSTRSSTLRYGSLHSTVRCAWSFSFRCTQSTVKSRRFSCARLMKSPRSFARVVCGGTLFASNTARSETTRSTAPRLCSR